MRRARDQHGAARERSEQESTEDLGLLDGQLPGVVRSLEYEDDLREGVALVELGESVQTQDRWGFRNDDALHLRFHHRVEKRFEAGGEHLEQVRRALCGGR